MTLEDARRVAEYCNTALNLRTVSLGTAFGYPNLSLCVIDAVWSIGVRYDAVQNVVSRYQDYCVSRSIEEEHHSLAEMIEAMQIQGCEAFARDIFRNFQRTSTKNGLLKAEAVYLFASALHEHGIHNMTDVPCVDWYEDLPEVMRQPFARKILTIPGQTSGVSLTYFLMLTGSRGIVKPDRMVFRFLQNATGKPISDADAQFLISYASRILNTDYPDLTPRALDHEIWKYQSGRI
jgi:hypothetical protein